MMIPRLALGTVQPAARTTWMARALMAVARQAGLQVQGFYSRAVFTPDCGAQLLTGRQTRHLDSWLMTDELCRSLFCENMRDADLGIVEGVYRQAMVNNRHGPALDTLCDWLELPQLVVLDVSRLSACRLPYPEFPVDGVFLDRVPNESAYRRWVVDIELFWRAPVFGGLLESAVPNRDVVIQSGSRLTDERLKRLCDDLASRLRWSELLALASRPMPLPATRWPWKPLCSGKRLVVAVAFDNAIQCYFPDTLDALEALGAELRTFSPLNDPELPQGTDLVYIGCGKVDQFAERLSANPCLRTALCRFARHGGRIYAEGGGAAYLCREVVINGKSFPMVGAFPATAHRMDRPREPRPVELPLRVDSWIGQSGDIIRGYLNPAWRFTPTPSVRELCSSMDLKGSFMACGNVIASRVHINFAARPVLLQRWLAVVSGMERS